MIYLSDYICAGMWKPYVGEIFSTIMMMTLERDTHSTLGTVQMNILIHYRDDYEEALSWPILECTKKHFKNSNRDTYSNL